MTPAAWATYEREKQDPADCPDFSADAARDLLGIKETPWVFDVIREVTDTNEIGYAQCSFSDPRNSASQVVFQMNRIVTRDPLTERSLKVLAMMQHLKAKSPLNAQYPGFGTNTTVGEQGSQTAVWACGNQWLTLSSKQLASAKEDQSSMLWKHFEPSIRRHCGTLEKPAEPLGFVPTGIKSGSAMRVNVVDDFIRRKNLDLPTSSSASTSPNRWKIDSKAKPQGSGHLKDIERCAMLSAARAVSAVGPPEKRSHVHGRAVVRNPWSGRDGQCSIHIGGEFMSKQTTSVEVGFAQYSTNSNVMAKHVEAIAGAHADPGNRGPYDGKYRGFGVIGRDESRTERTVQWLCGGYLVEGSFRPPSQSITMSDSDLWSLTEPTIRRICGKPNEPMTPPLGWDLRRVDYTQLLMEDWKIGTDNQLMDPPDKRRYVKAKPGATRNG